MLKLVKQLDGSLSLDAGSSPTPEDSVTVGMFLEAMAMRKAEKKKAKKMWKEASANMDPETFERCKEQAKLLIARAANGEAENNDGGDALTR